MYRKRIHGIMVSEGGKVAFMKIYEELLSRKEKVKHYLVYFLFGVLSTMVSFGSLWAFRTFLPTVEKNTANTISIIIAILFAYIVNRIFVFKSKEKNIMKEFFKFALSRGFSFLFEVFFFWLLTFLLPNSTFYELVAKLVCTFCVMILNYIFSKCVVFQNSQN